MIVGGFCDAAGCRFELTREITGGGDNERKSAERAATLFERALLVVASMGELLPTCHTASAKSAALAHAAKAAVVVKYATDLVEDALDDAGTRGSLVPVMMAQFRAQPLIPIRGGEKSLTTKVDEVADSLENEYPHKAAALHDAANLLSWLARHDNPGAVGIGRQRV